MGGTTAPAAAHEKWFFDARNHPLRWDRILYGLFPLILGVHVAVPLLTDGTQTRPFSPNDTLTRAPAFIVGLSETFIALSLFYGGLTRVSAGRFGARRLGSSAPRRRWRTHCS